MAYRDYLKSKDWKYLRNWKLMDSGLCEICHYSRGKQVHHILYRKRFSKTKLGDLRVLCAFCHKTLHEIEDWLALPDNPFERFAVLREAVRAELERQGCEVRDKPKKKMPWKKYRKMRIRQMKKSLQTDDEFTIGELRSIGQTDFAGM